MTVFKRITLLALIFSFFSAGISAAEEKTKQAALPGVTEFRQALRKVIVVKEEQFAGELDSYLRYMPSSGASGQSGKVGIVDSVSEYSYEAKAFGKLPVELVIGTEYMQIKNTTAIELPSHLTSVSFGLETIVPFFNLNKVYFSAGLASLFTSDDWDFHSSSFRIPQRYFLIYQPNEQLTLVCGVGVWPDYKETVWPIVGFIYKPNEKLIFNLVPKTPEISYAVDERLTLFAQADMSQSEYEVTQGERKNAVLEYNEMHLGAGVRYKFNRRLRCSLSAGSIFNRSIKYRDDSLGKVAVEDGFYTEFRLDFGF
ncbi:MAG: DUF6268 family outer membrane beta-barrel protein [Candidatus Omnitrophota bacterium]